jgi:hypothetical protein
MPLPIDYLERVYAGVLGKLIGVYLGRPFDGWPHAQIMDCLGDVWYYVNERRDLVLKNHLLVVTDDDISGTFTFVRALADYGCSRGLTPAQIGQTWLNYIVDQRTTLWWGGLGHSTEHTAYLRLRAGVPAPDSGSARLNGPIVAQQIGAQIFVDGWAMVAPGDPALAADLARRAASVSHDGEALYAAQLLAAMEAQAFVEPDLACLVETGLSFVPADCTIARMVNDLREWHTQQPDWRAVLALIQDRYGYDRYPGNCHVVPNHALIHLGLLYGAGDFQRSLMITNTAGWDTDCNSGNLGCLLGLRGGLAALDAGPDWRGPVADRLYLSTSDGGRAVTDAVTETYHLVSSGRALTGQPPMPAPKGGARFHFSLPGSLQGFQPEDPRRLVLANAGPRGLALQFRGLAYPHVARAATPTFVPPEAIAMPGYGLSASPSLYSGQTVHAAVAAGEANPSPVTVSLYASYYGPGDALVRADGPAVSLAPGAHSDLEWTLPPIGGAPLEQVGLQLSAEQRVDGVVYLDRLGWNGAPDVVFQRPAHGGQMWRRAWVDAVDYWGDDFPDAFRLAHNRGIGLVITGTREWRDYEVSTTLTPWLAATCGLAARVQGLRRYYALLLAAGGQARLVRMLDGETVLAETRLAVDWGRPYALCLRVTGQRLRACVDGHWLFDVEDPASPLTGGGIALLCAEGCLSADEVAVRPTR